MTEKAYKTMGTAGAANLALGIILNVNGARLLKAKQGLTF